MHSVIHHGIVRPPLVPSRGKKTPRNEYAEKTEEKKGEGKGRKRKVSEALLPGVEEMNSVVRIGPRPRAIILVTVAEHSNGGYDGRAIRRPCSSRASPMDMSKYTEPGILPYADSMGIPSAARIDQTHRGV